MKNLYRLDSPFTYKHPALSGISFLNERCSIADGSITVNKWYAWDGCSPKFDFAGLVVIGVPDGRLYEGFPITYYPSLVHDVLCQFRSEIPITKDHALTIFNDMLKDVGFLPRPLYVAAVKHFGPQLFAGDPA